MDQKGKTILIGAEDEENLAIRYLGAVLREEGHIVRIVPCTRDRDIPKAINKLEIFQPDLVGVSIAFQSLANMFFRLIRRIKKIKPEVHVTVGGHFPTFEYTKILKKHPVDTIIRFEGEKPILMLMNFLKEGNLKEHITDIPNLVYSNENGKIIENRCLHEFPDLEKVPIPLRNNKAHIRLGERFSTLVGSRGCFYSKCLYCCIGAFHQKKEAKYALRSPDSVAREMGWLYHQKKVRLFQFHDDNFLLSTPPQSLSRIAALKTALQRENISTEDIAIIIKTRPDSINEDLLSSLVDLGVIGVFLGVENASSQGLKALSRGTTVEDINRALRILERGDVAVTFNLLIFHPRASLDEINHNLYFLNNNQDKAFDFGRAEIVAGSPLEKLVQSKNLLRGEWPQWDYIMEDPAVEKMFRIHALTFYGEKSPYPDLSHQIIALSYRAQLLNHFYPGKKSQGLQSETRDMIKKSNKFTLEKMLLIYQLTAQTEIEEKIKDLNEKMEFFYKNLIKEGDNLSDKMFRFQIMERKFQDYGLENCFQNSKFMGRIFRI